MAEEATWEELFGEGDDEDDAPAPAAAPAAASAAPAAAEDAPVLPEKDVASPPPSPVKESDKKDKKDKKDKGKKDKEKDKKDKKDKKEKDKGGKVKGGAPALPVIESQRSKPAADDKKSKKDGKDGKEGKKSKKEEKDKKDKKDKKAKKRDAGEAELDKGSAAKNSAVEQPAAAAPTDAQYDHFDIADIFGEEEGAGAGGAAASAADQFGLDDLMIGGDDNTGDGGLFGDIFDMGEDLNKVKPIKLKNPPKAKASKKQRLAEAEELAVEEVEQVPENLNERFMKVLDAIKIKKPLSIKDADAQVFVQKAISDMHEAAKADEECLLKNQPGMHKMKMLPKVIMIMTKFQFAMHFVLYDGCKAVAKWLQKLPNGRLPNDHLRTELLQALTRLPINKDALKTNDGDAKLGQMVDNLARHRSETIANRKLAASLVQSWVKMVLAPKIDPENMEVEAARGRLERPPPESAEFIAEQMKASEGRMHPEIPSVGTKEYVIKPTPRAQPVRREKIGAETNRGKLGEVLKTLSRPNKKSWKPYAVSIAGRGVNAL